MENPFELILERLERIEIAIEKLNSPAKNESETLLSRKEACELLKIDSSTLWSWTKKGKITCYGIAARRYYKRDEILNCLVVLK